MCGTAWRTYICCRLYFWLVYFSSSFFIIVFSVVCFLFLFRWRYKEDARLEREKNGKEPKLCPLIQLTIDLKIIFLLSSPLCKCMWTIWIMTQTFGVHYCARHFSNKEVRTQNTHTTRVSNSFKSGHSRQPKQTTTKNEMKESKYQAAQQQQKTQNVSFGSFAKTTILYVQLHLA